jgi:hypothetical protein
VKSRSPTCSRSTIRGRRPCRWGPRTFHSRTRYAI